MNKSSQQIIKIFNILILATAILIIVLLVDIKFKLSSVPDWTSRSGTLQVHPELREPIKSSIQFLWFLLAIETVIIWLSILLNLFLKRISQGNWYSRSLLNNTLTGLLFTFFILCLYIYTLPIMMICDYPYC